MTTLYSKYFLDKTDTENVSFKNAKECDLDDILNTICSFSNHIGGVINIYFDNKGNISETNNTIIDKLQKSLIKEIRNTKIIYPLLYVKTYNFEIDYTKILVIEVPISKEICKYRGRIFYRKNDLDIDITDNYDLICKIFKIKNNNYFLDTVTNFSLEDLRSDLIERARHMASAQKQDHVWKIMSDEELLRNAGLILTDKEKNIEGVTLAGILLFGKDITIMSTFSYHKTDAILRVENVDRYDDRDVIITNLLESYDRLLAFGEKHLSDPFALVGTQCINVRSFILREIIVNSLAHRDYSSKYTAKFVIEQDRLFTENANVAYGFGKLNLNTFEPHAKNPTIAKVFREIGLADEIGSGIKNTYKYTKLYSGQEPEFFENDVFRTIIPLKEVATLKVGPTTIEQHNEININLNITKQQNDILNFCIQPRSKREIMAYCQYKNIKYFTNKYINPLIEDNLLQMVNKDKPNSKNQKYITNKIFLQNGSNNSK